MPQHPGSLRGEGISVRGRQGQVHPAQRSPPNPAPPSAAEDLSSPEGGSSTQPKKDKKKKKKQGTHTESFGLGTEQTRRATATRRGGARLALPVLVPSAKWLSSLQSERQLRQRYFSSAVLSSTSNILSDIQEYTYLQMKGISYAIDFCAGSALCAEST